MPTEWRSDRSLIQKSNALNKYSRRNNLQIYGEDTVELIIKIWKDKLSIDIQRSNVDVSHWQKAGEYLVKALLVRLTNSTIKQKIYDDKRKLKGSKIVIEEYFTLFIVALLRELQNNSPPKSFWTSEGTMFCKSNNVIYKIESIDYIRRIKSCDKQPSKRPRC